MRAVLCFWFIITLSGCSTTQEIPEQDVIWNDNPAVRIDLNTVQTRFADDLRTGKIRRLNVLQIRRDTKFRTNVSSILLERNYDYQVEHRRVRSSSIGLDFLTALNEASPTPSQQVADLRWGFIFSDENGTRAFSVYCDAEGKNGIIDGACYTFSNGVLAEFAASLFPSLMK